MTDAATTDERAQARARFAAPRAPIDAHLDRLTTALPVPTNLRDAIRYSLLSGGKRVRPLFAWHAAVAVAGDPDAGPASLPAGAAVELIHAFSLVHDDLPAMDDDDLRRGKPTLHIHAGEAMAILAGDAMLSLASSALSVPPEGGGAIGDGLHRRLVAELNAGTLGMISGQVLDTLGGFEAGVPDADRVERIHREKTGALITAACRMGALIGLDRAGLDPEGDGAACLDAVSRYAEAIGLMFQVVDDLLDVEQSSEHLGKRAGKDADAGKLTYPGVHGVERSRAFVGELLDCAVDALAQLPEKGARAESGAGGEDVLRELASYLAQRTK